MSDIQKLGQKTPLPLGLPQPLPQRKVGVTIGATATIGMIQPCIMPMGIATMRSTKMGKPITSESGASSSMTTGTQSEQIQENHSVAPQPTLASTPANVTQSVIDASYATPNSASDRRIWMQQLGLLEHWIAAARELGMSVETKQRPDGLFLLRLGGVMAIDGSLQLHGGAS